MWSLSMFTFYFHRDFNLEYWNRMIINNALRTPSQPQWISYDKVNSIPELHHFLNGTIADQIF